MIYNRINRGLSNNITASKTTMLMARLIGKKHSRFDGNKEYILSKYRGKLYCIRVKRKVKVIKWV